MTMVPSSSPTEQAQSPECSRRIAAPPGGAIWLVRDTPRADGRGYRRARYFRRGASALAYAAKLEASGVSAAVFTADVRWRVVQP